MKIILLASSAMSLIACAGAASAQEQPAPAAQGPSVGAQTTPTTPVAAPPQAPPAPGAQATAQEGAATNGGAAQPVALQEVVVTAQRRSENLQRTPQAITAISGASLLSQGISTSQDLTNAVPGVNISQAAGAANQIRIRGVGTAIFNAFTDPEVAFSVDGVFQSRPTGADGVFFDLDRLEVVKGPQGTLYGRNATSGAINIITKKPTQTFGGDFSVEAGDYDELRTTGALNLPLTDTLAARIAYQTVSHSGYLSNGYDDADNQAARVHVLWKPNSAVSLLLTGDFYHEGAKSPYGDVPLTASGGYLNPSNPYQAPPSGDPRVPADQARCVGAAVYQAYPYCSVPGAKTDNVNWSVGAQLDWNLGFGALTVIPAYRDVHPQYTSFPREVPQIVDLESKQTTVETRLASVGDTRLKWLVGFFYLNEDQDADQTFYQINRYPHPPYAVSPTYDDVKPTDESLALFTQDTFSITSRLRLTGGLRYTYEHKTKTGEYDVPTTAAACAGPNGVYAAQGTTYDGSFCHLPEQGTLTNDSVQGRAALDFDLTPRNLLYASYSVGTHAGGFYIGLAPNTFKPEELKAYAVGSKNTFFDNRLRLNAEFFYWDYENLQVSNAGTITPPITYAFITVNAGNSTDYGFDLDAEYLITPHDRLFASVENAETDNTSLVFPVISPPPAGSICTYTGQAPSITENCSNSKFILTPKWSGNVGYEHTFVLGQAGEMLLSADTHFETSSFLSADNSATQVRHGFTDTDVNLTYTPVRGRWSVTGFVRNAENTATPSSLSSSTFTSTPWVTLQPPRTFGGRVQIAF